MQTCENLITMCEVGADVRQGGHSVFVGVEFLDISRSQITISLSKTSAELLQD